MHWMWIQFLGQEDTLEKEMVTRSRIGKFQGQNLVGYCLWGRKVLDTTEPLSPQSGMVALQGRVGVPWTAK